MRRMNTDFFSRINSDIILRLGIASFLMHSPLTWLVGGYSSITTMSYLQPDKGFIIVLLMAFVSLIIYLDVFINSIFACEPKWHWARKNRDNLYVAGGILCALVLWALARHDHLTFSAGIFYFLLIAICFTFAIVDSLAQRRGQRCDLERRKFRRD